ncbi:hypothetical protein PR202_ga19363 [Eleusine coracana subsp. coracana]|uniref:RWP-RK domain-containing protein n=1 Tax=Eleusine coracana subsp. coracana TaxID=191504 RepID=A0AAV5CW00_ELECO|nr:hypothetical protein PR202_ga19363 [Eleusine coracana subsp. coracana]
MDACVSILTALAIFESRVEHGAVRSVHGYKVVGRKAGVGWVRWERWVERGFVLSTAGSREVGVPHDTPRVLQAGCLGRPAFREGQAVGDWRCIVAFDSVAAVKPSSPPPPMLCPTGNPQLKCLPNLYNDLEKVFQFQSEEKLRQLFQSDFEEQQQSIHSGEPMNISDEADYASDTDSDSDEDPQSGTVQKHQRANKTHIASITLVEIAQCFHLPIREASKTLKIGVSVLKKKCREYGIPRWPHRKIKSLDSLIHDLEDVLGDQTRDDVQLEKEKQALAIRALTKRKRMLEREKEAIRQKPASDLMTETKQFREDVFKRRNRAKRASD